MSSKFEFSNLKLFHTNNFECGYFKALKASYVVLDPQITPSIKLQETAAEKGYRRSGNSIYYPWCHSCNKCVPIRLKLNDFILSRSQKRCLAKNSDLEIVIAEPHVNDDIFNLYKNYQEWKHPAAGMDECENASCMDFLKASWSDTKFIMMLHKQKIIAVTVVDVFNKSLSAVYAFYAKKYSAHSLGTFAVLWQIKYAQSLKLDYLYLGFYIKDSPKMSYKNNFKPHEFLLDGKWH